MRFSIYGAVTGSVAIGGIGVSRNTAAEALEVAEQYVRQGRDVSVKDNGRAITLEQLRKFARE